MLHWFIPGTCHTVAVVEMGEPRKGADVVVAGVRHGCEVPGCCELADGGLYDGVSVRFVCGVHRGAVRLGFVLAGALSDAA